MAAPAWAAAPRDVEIALAKQEIRASKGARQRAELSLRLGELYFDGGRTASALAAYGMVPRRSDAYRDALSGRARCYIESGALRSALATLSELAVIAEKDALLDVRDDTADKVRLAWRDIIAVAARRGEPDQAQRLFRKRGSVRALSLIAEFYRAQDRREDASEVYRQLILLDGSAVRTCEWQDEITRNGLAPGFKGEGRAIPKQERAMSDRYTTCVERATHRLDPVALQYHRAWVSFEYDHFWEAEQLFEDIVRRHQDHPFAGQAGSGLLASLNGQGKTDEVIRWTDELLHMDLLTKDHALEQSVRSRASDAYDTAGHAFERQGNYKECGRSMLAAAAEQPNHPRHAARLWHASLCFEQAHLVGMTLKMRQELIQSHPTSRFGREALFRIAAGYADLRYD